MSDRALTGVIIDAGHGGDDPGAVSGNAQEKEYTLQIAQYLYDRFKELGIPVYMVRDSDETLDSEERIARIKEFLVDNPNTILISNHLNSGGGTGAEVIYALRNKSTLSDTILRELENEGQYIRRAYQRRLPGDTSKDYYYIIRDTAPIESILIEYGFIDNPNDLARIRDNYQNYAEAVVRAVLEYKNIPYDGESGNVYTVKAGDSLYSIARVFNTTVEAIKQLNNLATNTLQIGQKLKIPVTVEVPSTNYYTVKAGDNLYSIARQFNTTVERLKALNNLTTNTLQIGQQLKVSEDVVIPPEPTEDYLYYTVVAGDNLYSIARRYNTTESALINANNLTSNILQIGQVLRIPVIETESPPEEITENVIYTVQPGDSLYSIAKRYNTTVDELKQLNNLTSNLLSIGQQLQIPATTSIIVPAYIEYTVKKGDSLYNIAKRYNTTVNAIKELNGLTSNLLSIGQKLNIPQ